MLLTDLKEPSRTKLTYSYSKIGVSIRVAFQMLFVLPIWLKSMMSPPVAKIWFRDSSVDLARRHASIFVSSF